MLKPLTVWITKNCGKFFERWEYQTTLPVSWEICMQVKKQQLEPDMGWWTGPNWERTRLGCILSPCLFNFCAEHIMRNAGLQESQAAIKIAGTNLNNLRYTGEGDGTPLQYSCLVNPMDGGAWWAAVHGVLKSQTDRLHFHFSFSCIGEGNGNPVQCSCLENPRDGGAWWAAVYGVAQSWTRLKRLSSSSSSRYTDDTALMAESKDKLKSLLIGWKRRMKMLLWNSTFKKTKIMASSPITSWQIEGRKCRTSDRFYFLGSKITVDGDSSHEIKRHLLLGRKPMTNLAY